jgi:two-component system response regulator AtoC
MQEEYFTVYVVEDNDFYNRLLVHYLAMNPEFRVMSFFNGKDLLSHLHERPDVITLDYRLPDMKGSDLLRKIRDFDDGIEVIVISEQDDIQTAVDLLKEGAFDYLVKNEEMSGRLHNTIGKIRKNAGLRKRIIALEQEVGKKYDFEKVIIGTSPVMHEVFEMMNKAASSNITVTISGETGTGKEMVAKAVHYHSARKDKPFVPVNMSAIPSELFESEFFGHEKGAFTGAVARRKGKFEEANGGTLFLDEIADTDINFQPKMLRALQEREITRVGSNETIKFDCRIIVASNRNLQDEVKKGAFRQDLYYRLYGLPIILPPLRDREKDVLILARHFMEEFSRDNKWPSRTLSEEAKARLMSYPWPGNVRELKSVIDLAMVMSSGDTLTANDIMLSQSDFLTDVISEEMTMRNYELNIVRYYLGKYHNNIKVVSEKLGIGQATIYRMLKES